MDTPGFWIEKMLGVQEDGSIDPRKRYSPGAALAKLEKGRQKREPRVAHTQLPSIEIRPKEIGERRENGHREMDLVVSCSKGKAAMLTSIDRRTKFAYNARIPNKKAESVAGVFDRWEREMGQERFRKEFKTVSTDNGSEFLKYTKLQTSIFEGTNFDTASDEEIAAWSAIRTQGAGMTSTRGIGSLPRRRAWMRSNVEKVCPFCGLEKGSGRSIIRPWKNCHSGSRRDVWRAGC